MPTIIISGTIIDFPDSAAAPNWAPAVIDFAQAVEGALEGLAGSFDVPPQTMTIDIYNPGTNVSITALNFPVSDVKSATIRYVVNRTTTTDNVVEAGTLSLVYNSTGNSNEKWEVSRILIGPGAQIEFSVTDAGQVRFTTTAIGGLNHTGTITFEAKSLTVA
jgi:hypothetical protein